jgi:RimJ/RimL family protein N-acetyltransferase
MIETQRLVLRPFRSRDCEPFAEINGDRRVSDWLGGPIDREASDQGIERINQHIADHGFGFWAAERKSDGRLIGMIGLKHMALELPPAPAIEAGWRLSPECWGQGFASEGAQAAVNWGFEHLGASEIVAITARQNLQSQKVMQRMGMTEQAHRAFEHPRLAVDHPLRSHVVFVALAT